MNHTKDTLPLPELLAPCGSPEALEAALAGGADAVYLGGTMFNARMNAKNFSRDALEAAVKRCHENGVRVYVTFNTLIFDREMKSAIEYAAYLYKIGVDALIVTDSGLISQLRLYLPQMELHASTQATVHCVEAAKFYRDLGFRRVVCAREMAKDDIERLVRGSGVEIEMFVHGAQCVSCSGQCLMSAMLGGRSGNRGECAQPCRMSYNGSFPLSLKDMCLAMHIPEIIESGVASLKIEGRMKSPDYVYGVVSIYRRLLDEHRAATQSEMDKLSKLFSRGGFTDGYYTSTVDVKMLGIRSENNIADSRNTHMKIPAVKARKEPIVLSREPVTIPKEAGAFSRGSHTSKRPVRSARFRTAKQIPETDYFDHIYLPLENFCSKGQPNSPKPDGVILPPVIFDHERESVRFNLKKAVEAGATHALIGNYGHLSLAREFHLIPVADSRLNVTNSFSSEFVCGLDFESVILSPELILPQIRDIACKNGTKKAVIVYGKIPLMLLERKTGLSELRDNRNARFPVAKEAGREIVSNSVPIYMADQPDRLDNAGIEEQHFVFTTEDRNEVLRVIYAYAHRVIPKDPVRRIK